MPCRPTPAGRSVRCSPWSRTIPSLKSQANVLSLQAEIERIEGIIADRRELYNDQVYRYNTRIRQIPAVLMAGFFGWRPREFFAAEDDDRTRPDVRLHQG